ncbi:helix-turn-helix domain-containing protein [Pseudactinotalea sp. Z1732]|uniref:helix-turn-helix domain-containing protein n=1 Tax=Micrococcales TaxID=85006 RepID=UPI003C7E5D89
MASLVDLAAQVSAGAPLTDLATLQSLRTEANRLEAVLVRRARNDGASWAQIAASLGISKQAVHKRYGGSRLSR